jgi:hypothetical protein
MENSFINYVCVYTNYLVMYCDRLYYLYPTPGSLFSVYFLFFSLFIIALSAKTGHGLHSSTLVVICVVRLLFLLFYVFFVCKCALPPGDNPIAVKKYININIFSNTDTGRISDRQNTRRLTYSMEQSSS